MQKRILLSLLGIKLNLPYETEAMRAVRAYLYTLLIPIFFIFFYFTAMGYVILLTLFTITKTPVDSPLSLSVLLGALAFVHYLRCAFLGWKKATENKTQNNEEVDLHLRFSSYVREIARLRGTPVIPVYASNVAYFAELRGYRETSIIAVSPQVAHAEDTVSVLGALAHELGHAVLPLGNFTFALCCPWFSRVDIFLKLLEHYLLTESGVKPTTPKKKGVIVVRQRHKLAMFLFRVLLPVSSYRVSEAREYAADALGALILGHTFPLISILSMIHSREVQLVGIPRLLSTHPRTTHRIAVLEKMEQLARTTR